MLAAQASAGNVAVISYDEKPGIQAMGNTHRCRRSPGFMAPSHVTRNTNPMAH
jgi:hypothetical protein